jgi:phenylacetate-CoA ligase
LGLKERVYQASPVWVQNLAVSTVGWSIRRQRFGPDFERILEEFMRRQWDSADALREFQNERLRRLVRHAYENVPHYRQVMDERKLRPSDITTVDDLPKLPLLTKDTLRNAPDSLRARNFPRRTLLAGETSGTTSLPLEVLWDRQMVRVNAAAEWRMKSTIGLSRTDRIATITGGRMVVPLRQSSPPFWRYNRPMRQLLLSGFHLSQKRMPDYIRALRAFRPVALEGYPSTASLLARHLIERGETIPLRCVLTSSESLLPGQRAAIEKAFECRVFDYYGMVERVVFATECEHHAGHHLNDDYGVTEILDDNSNPLPPGRLGRITGTSLHNFGMPLIRYVTNDLTARRESGCGCRRAFPLTESVTGRSGDFLVTPDGRLIPTATVEVAGEDVRGLYEWQIIQDAPDHIIVDVVLGQEGAQSRDKLEENLRELLGDYMRIEVRVVDRIHRSAGLKHRLINSSVPVTV